MSEPFLAEIRIFGFNFAPKGWAMCDGQLLPINQNQSLYSLLGTTYGGDGRTTFQLPDLRGRVPIHFDSGHALGSKSGEEGHTLAISEMPSHDHVLQGANVPASAPGPSGALLANASTQIYNTPQSLQTLHNGTIASTGDSQAHENMSPFLVLNFCIALQGLFPSRN